jgi:hypothetical protein
MISAKQKERRLIIKLRNERRTYVKVGEILGNSKSKVSYWTFRYNQTGCLEVYYPESTSFEKLL